MTSLRAAVLMAALGSALMGGGPSDRRVVRECTIGPQLKTGTREELRAKRKKERKSKKRSRK